MSETMRCSWCGQDVDPEGHRWECTGHKPEPTLTNPPDLLHTDESDPPEEPETPRAVG